MHEKIVLFVCSHERRNLSAWQYSCVASSGWKTEISLVGSVVHVVGHALSLDSRRIANQTSTQNAPSMYTTALNTRRNGIRPEKT